MLLKEYPDAIETYGFVTKANRENFGLMKDHYIDACVIASGGLDFEHSDILYKKKCIPTQNRCLAQGPRGERVLPKGKVHGFKRYDKVKYLEVVCFVKTRRVRGAFVLMDIDNNSLDFRSIGGIKEPSYKCIKRLSARKSVLCINKHLKR